MEECKMLDPPLFLQVCFKAGEDHYIHVQLDGDVFS